VPLDPKPVAKLIRAVEKAFPLLEFTVWSTAQINPWMHHLLAHPVAFLHAPTDTLESIGDTLRAQGWEVAVRNSESSRAPYLNELTISTKRDSAEIVNQRQFNASIGAS
jgi:hypothetical protein